MPPTILRDHEATVKLLEAILDAPGGKRSLSRLARTCKEISEMSLNVLWRELDSLNPLIGLFPSHLFKKARRPTLGLIKPPHEDDWKKVLAYGERVRRIAYDESLNNVAPSIFSIINEYRPRTYILPNLQQLTWKATTSVGLDRAEMFLNEELRELALEIGNRLPQLNSFLADLSSRTRLSSFSFISTTALPDAFIDLLLPQSDLRKIVLVAPGALSPRIGRWVASLPHLRTLQLDLSARSDIAVEGFFDDIRPRHQSGHSTPTSVKSVDSGVFSGEESDFADFGKSSPRFTGELRPTGWFSKLQQLHLTGEAFNITVFLNSLTSSSLTLIELVVEDPISKADWQNLSTRICDKFGHSLRSLRISATTSSRFVDLVRSTSRAEPSSNHLSLEHFTNLTSLVRLDIDLPQSNVFHPSDIVYLTAACPNIEVLRLCPLARFPLSSGPKLFLSDLAPLVSGCRRLHTLSVVVNADGGSAGVLASPATSSRSLLRVHLGHSWVDDPLKAAILLSHFAPHLEYLKWFHEKGRSGVVEANAQRWQTVSEYLPNLQNMRLMERSFHIVVPTPKKLEKSIDASLSTEDRGITARPSAGEAFVQCSPLLTDRAVVAKPQLLSASVDARPSFVDVAIHSSPLLSDQAVDACPSTISTGVDTMISPSTTDPPTPDDEIMTVSYFMRFLSFFKLLISYPLFIPWRVADLSVSTSRGKVEETQDTISEKPPVCDSSFVASGISPANEPEHVSGLGVISEYVSDTQGLQTSIYSAVTRQSQENWPWLIFTSPQITMAEPKKQEKDFKPEVDFIIPVTESLVQSGQLQEALDHLFALEKQTRNASDLSSTKRLVKAALESCYQVRSYDLLNSSITLLSKKHGQLKGAVQEMVELAMGWLDEIKKEAGIDKWLQLVDTLRGVTEGKIFLETPRARITLLLSHYHESLANSIPPTPTSQESLQTASDLLLDLQVETYSTMDRREKTTFILEQMRLLIAVARQKDAALGKGGKDSLGGGEGEWVKVKVGGRKINEEFLKEQSNEDLKLKFYDLMIQYALNEGEYLDVAKYYHKVWQTPSIKDDVNGKGKAALEHIVYYVVLAPHNNEQSDMLHRLFADPALAKLELQYNLVKSFTTRELMRWPGIVTIYGPFLRCTSVFMSDSRWEDLHTRVIEHNIRVVAEYYTRITLHRLTSLLDLTKQQTEDVLARLVVSGTIWARIDRPAGIVNFRSKRSTEDVMNDWSSDMQKLLGLVEKTWMGMNAAQAAQSRVKA